MHPPMLSNEPRNNLRKLNTFLRYKAEAKEDWQEGRRGMWLVSGPAIWSDRTI